MSKEEDLFDDIYSMSKRKLLQNKDKNYNLDIIEQVVESSLDFFDISKSNFTDFKRCCAKLLENAKIEITESSMIKDDTNHIDWYYPINIERPYWETHKVWLGKNLKLPLTVINSIDRSTDDILSKLEDPNREGNWDRRGIVVGSVQSGKTGHFIALANKAVDAGYKRIVVLSGLTNDLRRQSNFRLDEGFFGFNTDFLGDNKTSLAPVDRRMALPLGVIRGNDFKRPFTLTSSNMKGDLNTASTRQANVMGDHPMLLCIKKNKTSLQNCIKLFLSSPEIENGVSYDQNPFKINSDFTPPYLKKSPILIIDDEVDHGSVDTGNQPYDENDEPNQEYNPKTINSLIRQLLNIHSKKAYVGYTATPISNIFIHEKGKTLKEGPDIFPKSFIYDLPVPSNYFGIEKMFSEDEDGNVNENFIKIIRDHCDDPFDLFCKTGWIPPKHKKNHNPLSQYGDYLPDSLREAIYSFLICSTLRNLRGQEDQHKSMLIHVSKYIWVNEKIFEQVVYEMEQIRSILKNPGDSFHQNAILKFKSLYEELRKNGMDKEISFEELLVADKGLKYVAGDVSKNIKNLIGNSEDILDYDTFKSQYKRGMNTIVIGGDRLSRGITLEGLTTSYFLRSSKMYDTLMQMGRWFGYRDGYQDLSRLYTTEDLSEWFEHISKAMSELRVQFRVMANYGSTPMNFGLKIKSHPLLMVTSKVKMRNGHELETNFVDHFSQTTTFKIDENINNLNQTNILINSLNEPDESGLLIRKNFLNQRDSYLWKNIDSTKVINFLKNFKIHNDSKSIEPLYYSEFIKKMNKYDELMEWTIGLMGAGNSKQLIQIADKFEVELVLRKPRPSTDNQKFSIGVLADPKHEGIDLTNEEIEICQDKSVVSKNIGSEFRRIRSKKRGLLLIYPIYTCLKIEDHEKAKLQDKKSNYTDIPTIGFSISFPSSSKVSEQDRNIKYVVNNIYYNDEYSNN